MPAPVKLKPIPLWEHWNKERLKAKRLEGERQFQRGFFLQAYSDEEATFSSYPNCRKRGLVLGDIQRNTNWPCFMGVDLSSKKRPGNAIAAVRVDPVTRYRYPIDIRFLAKPGPEVCEALNVMDQLYSPVVIFVEDNGYQDSLFDWIGDAKARFPFWLKVEPTTTDSGRKGHAERGLPGMEVEFKNEAWCFPYSDFEGATVDDPAPKGWWARLDQEFRFHPLAVSSDGVMALWFARQAIDRYGNFHTYEAGGTGVGDPNLR